MQQANNTHYKIKYIECQEKGHHGEKVNLICLDRECSEASLICSLCTTSKHANHNFKPLKFYIDELYSNYHNTPSKYGIQLEEL